MQQKQPKSKTDKDFEQLGRMMSSVYETGYFSRARSYRMSFMRGLFQGFGAAVGATVLVGLLIWILSLFSQVPLLSRFTENLRKLCKFSNKSSYSC